MVELENADEASRTALAFWGEATDRLPPVHGVLSDPACERTDAQGLFRAGFVNPESGRCVGGFFDGDHGIYILVHPWFGYDTTLPHEIQHWLRGDGGHNKRGVWEDREDNLVPRANAWLRMWPEVNTMRVVGE